jgi:hypothetical protein
MVGLFLALLELVRQKLIQIEQEKTFGPIYIFALTEAPPEEAVAHAVSADINKLPSHLQKERHDPADSSELSPEKQITDETGKTGEDDEHRNETP